MPSLFRFIMDEAFIYVSVISGLFGLIGLQLLTHNWFKKERFKLEAYNMKKQNDLQLKKMAHDLGLPTGKSTPPSTAAGPAGLDLMSLWNNLNPTQKQGILNGFLGNAGGGLSSSEEEYEPEDSGEGNILNDVVKGFAQSEQGQKMIQNFIGGAVQGGAKSQETGSQV